MKKGYYYATVIGCIGIAEEDGSVTNVFFGRGAEPDAFEVAETLLLRQAAAQLMEYLAGRRRHFTVPLAPVGNAFEQVVWDALQAVPYGEKRTYSQMADVLDGKHTAHAVGVASGQNPVAILIPNHRLVGEGGETVAYAGGLELKLRLLALEAQ